MILFRKLFCAMAVITLAACTSYKSVPYLQNVEQANALKVSNELYDAKIMPKDILTVTVNCSDPTASAPFNLTVQSMEASQLNSGRSTTQAALQQYLVSNDGTIDFPVLGVLKVGGLTKNQAEAMIREKLQPYLKETPVVTVRMPNFKIAVLGEVTTPGTFTISNEKVNVLEALALAKDMTIWGRRDSVKLVREDATGQRQIYFLNLNDANIIHSPYYQLQQNDVLYVTPNKTKAKNSDIGQSTSLWFSATSILVSLASLLYNILK
ncbi:MAG: polysaccharide biosynthesis/export family protein [Bacteroidaceae bacterium]|nr:polysaccharide biosynthesis/export family protein [Candidatus Minthousia equi]MCQ2245614.1 polysaccharide biosynthesis/export family protein [Bacteroidaceae bacterium]